MPKNSPGSPILSFHTSFHTTPQSLCQVWQTKEQQSLRQDLIVNNHCYARILSLWLQAFSYIDIESAFFITPRFHHCQVS
jgi:hypothetical protein